MSLLASTFQAKSLMEAMPKKVATMATIEVAITSHTIGVDTII